MSAGAGKKAVVTMKNSMVTTGDITAVVIAVLLPVTTMKLTRLC